MIILDLLSQWCTALKTGLSGWAADMGNSKKKCWKVFEFPKMDSVKLWNPKPESRKDTFDSSMDDFGEM